MYLNDLMTEHNMSRAALSRISGVPDSTLRDILNGKAQLDRCEAGTLLNIADVLDTTVEEIILHYWDEEYDMEDAFDNEQKRNYVHDANSLLSFYRMVDAVILSREERHDFRMIFHIREENMVEKLYSMGHYREALFLLGIIDYFDKKFGMMKDDRFDAYRNSCLDRPVYALSTLEEYDDNEALNDAKAYAEAYAIPELAAFNIFMTEEDISPDED